MMGPNSYQRPGGYWHYCLLCERTGKRTRTPNEFGIKQHLRTFHGLTGVARAGEHYVDEQGFAHITNEREKVHEATAARFALALATIRGADDFLLDCGDTAPVEDDEDDE